MLYFQSPIQSKLSTILFPQVCFPALEQMFFNKLRTMKQFQCIGAVVEDVWARYIACYAFGIVGLNHEFLSDNLFVKHLKFIRISTVTKLLSLHKYMEHHLFMLLKIWRDWTWLYFLSIEFLLHHLASYSVAMQWLTWQHVGKNYCLSKFIVWRPFFVAAQLQLETTDAAEYLVTNLKQKRERDTFIKESSGETGERAMNESSLCWFD